MAGQSWRGGDALLSWGRRATGGRVRQRASFLAAACVAMLLALSGAGVWALLGGSGVSFLLPYFRASTPPFPRSARVARAAVDTPLDTTLAGLVSDAAAPQARREAAQAVAEEKMAEEEEEDDVVTPVLYQLPEVFRRLRRSDGMRPGHVVQRRWLQKGKNQGYVSVPFSSAVWNVMKPEKEVNVCLVGRRERSDQLSKSWLKLLDELPLFDITGEAIAPVDLDPLEPSWEADLDDLPDEEALVNALRDQRVSEKMEQQFLRRPEELKDRVDGHGPWAGYSKAKVLREVIAGLPNELLVEENRELVRTTVLELLKLLWTTHAATGTPRLTWRFTCTDSDLEPEKAQASTSKPFALRAYFVLAGEGLEFMAEKFVDKEKTDMASVISEEQLARMSSQDWAKTVSKTGTNMTEALKRVPAGWTTLFKGDRWPGHKEGMGAIHRLPQTGRRLLLQVDVVDVPGVPQSDDEEAEASSDSSDSSTGGSAEGEQDSGSGPSPGWLGPLAGVALALFEIAKKSPPFVAGQQRRKEADALVRGLSRVAEPEAIKRAEKAMRIFEQRSWRADFGPSDEAPSVLVIGGQSPTGRVICKKLVMRGYHVTLLNEAMKNAKRREARVTKELPQGSMLSQAPVVPSTEPAYVRNIPDDIYDAVSGIDKFVVCDVDGEGSSDSKNPDPALSSQGLKNVLSTWQLYRHDFAEAQRSYTSKVQIFNFERDTDFEVWDLERKNPSDTCYGNQRAGWVRSSWGSALFIGGFLEPIGQCTLACPTLKLNLKRFSGLLMNVYNQAVNNKYSFFLRTSDFETTRIQYEYEFECQASSWHNVRMPFNAFRPIRCDGMELPEDSEEAQRPLDRGDVVQMGLVVRTTGEQVEYESGERINPFSLQVHFIKVFRTQPEPQVVYLGRQSVATVGRDESAAGDDAEDDQEEEELFFTGDDAVDASYSSRAEAAREAELEAEAEIDELVRVDDPLAAFGEEAALEFFKGSAKNTAQAVVESGLAFTMIKVNGLNGHPSGKFPVSISQASVRKPPLSMQPNDLGSISRGDAAELVVSALMEPSCVNAEITAGEPPRGESASDTPEASNACSLQIGSTLEEDVKRYLSQLTPNT